MLQIIGWLGCVYLLLRSLQMAYSRDMQDDEGKMQVGAMFTMILGITAALVFAFWLGDQGAAFAPESDLDRLSREAIDAENKAACMEAAVAAGRSPLEC